MWKLCQTGYTTSASGNKRYKKPLSGEIFTAAEIFDEKSQKILAQEKE